MTYEKYYELKEKSEVRKNFTLNERYVMYLFGGGRKSLPINQFKKELESSNLTYPFTLPSFNKFIEMGIIYEKNGVIYPTR